MTGRSSRPATGRLTVTPSNDRATLRNGGPGVVDGVCFFVGGGAFGKPDDHLLAMLAGPITHHLLELVQDAEIASQKVTTVVTQNLRLERELCLHLMWLEPVLAGQHPVRAGSPQPKQIVGVERVHRY